MQKLFEARGVIVPLLTPFILGGEAINEAALRTHIEWLIEKGVHGLMPCGTTGEMVLLSLDERKRVLDVTLAAAAARVAVIAHVGAASTQETIELARHAAAAGADAVSVVTPYYYTLPDEALVAHYCLVADAVPETPLFLYNIPQNTNNRLTRTVAETIVAHSPNVIGIKDSAGNFDTLAEFVGINEGQFQVICGSDSLLLRALQAGAVGGVSGNCNVVPEIVVALYDAFVAGDIARAQEQQRLLDLALQAMRNGGNLALLKAMADMRGAEMGGVRAPLAQVSAALATETAEKLAQVGVPAGAAHVHPLAHMPA